MDWYKLLLAMRKAFGDVEFTVDDVNALQTFSGEDPRKTASGWVSKFVKWKYIEIVKMPDGEQTTGESVTVERTDHRTGEIQTFERSRWIRTYQLTEYGLERKKPKGRMKFEED